MGGARILDLSSSPDSTVSTASPCTKTQVSLFLHDRIRLNTPFETTPSVLSGGLHIVLDLLSIIGPGLSSRMAQRLLNHFSALFSIAIETIG
jgi:hypothetical protein